MKLIDFFNIKTIELIAPFNHKNFNFLEFNNSTKDLIKNTIINSNSISDLFFIATLDPQFILDFFDEEDMYNKLIFFTDPFYNCNIFTKYK